ncbi:MAG: ParB/RepB/Spo0J family partition protein [Caldilineaceae bacterium]
MSATLASLPDAGQLASWQQEFLAETGYRLCLAAAGPAAAAPTPAAVAAAAGAVEIAVAQVRISATQAAQPLNPAKLDNAIQRARRDERIAPPIAVRRLRDGYLLLDGLYRLRAAQALGLERVAAVVEG